MVNPDHCKLFKNGILTVNKWKEENPDECLDLRGIKIAYKNFRKINLSKVNLSESPFVFVDFSSSLLINCGFHETNLTHAKMNKVTVINSSHFLQ